jgi:hypothetical protein
MICKFSVQITYKMPRTAVLRTNLRTQQLPILVSLLQHSEVLIYFLYISAMSGSTEGALFVGSLGLPCPILVCAVAVIIPKIGSSPSIFKKTSNSKFECLREQDLNQAPLGMGR